MTQLQAVLHNGLLGALHIPSAAPVATLRHILTLATSLQLPPAAAAGWWQRWIGGSGTGRASNSTPPTFVIYIRHPAFAFKYNQRNCETDGQTEGDARQAGLAGAPLFPSLRPPSLRSAACQHAAAIISSVATWAGAAPLPPSRCQPSTSPNQNQERNLKSKLMSQSAPRLETAISLGIKLVDQIKPTMKLGFIR